MIKCSLPGYASREDQRQWVPQSLGGVGCCCQGKLAEQLRHSCSCLLALPAGACWKVLKQVAALVHLWTCVASPGLLRPAHLCIQDPPDQMSEPQDMHREERALNSEKLHINQW